MSLQKKYSCLVVDDEPPAREILRRYIQQTPMLTLAGEYGNALKALEALSGNTVDLLFLDIQMPQVSGLDLITSLKRKPKIILTTAFEEYAVKAFELDVTDYLVKPIRFERFLKAIMKAVPEQEFPQPEPTVPPTQDQVMPAFLYFKADRKMVKVLLGEIIFIESIKDYVKIHTTRETVVTRQSMAGLEAMLPGDKFLRVHRSFFVSIDFVESYTQEEIGIGKSLVPIGKLYRQQVMKVLAGPGSL